MRRGRLAWPVAFALLVPGTASAQQAASREYDVKAAYLLNFVRYIEWPAGRFESPAAPLRICLLGTDPFGGALERSVAGRRAHGRPIVVARVDRPADARECHLVFIPDTEWRRRPDVLGAVRTNGVVTVGEGREFAEAGGVLSFVRVGESLRFAVNLDAQDEAGVRISSRMLDLAAALHGDGGGRPR